MCDCCKHDDPLLGCIRQKNLLKHEYGTQVLETAAQYARRLPQPLTRHDRLACFSIAQKYVEDEPISRHDLFPGISNEELSRIEWRVLDMLGFRLRG